jgi:hypothetical protein
LKWPHDCILFFYDVYEVRLPFHRIIKYIFNSLFFQLLFIFKCKHACSISSTFMLYVYCLLLRQYVLCYVLHSGTDQSLFFVFNCFCV